ncbi:uncharacterized protein (DUF427 family) [Variovorax boronicumulans]|uniref:DUF427 domain-containing protein n=1 Tax=Variovorax boronicumulans TaxID=436515 RepID=UPI00278B1091|nr:DUF427 domain-containing protein [Variovorax boronicumulans]MDQ0086463.1 uncharacterized protein (DUF427 family) [Variovorax boronicumulans]
MSRSSGHQKRPGHRVQETRVQHPVEVEVEGVVIAASTHVVKVDEARPRALLLSPRRRQDGETGALSHDHRMPVQRDGELLQLESRRKTAQDAVWTYEAPYDEHLCLKARLAFYDDRFPEIRVRISPDE